MNWDRCSTSHARLPQTKYPMSISNLQIFTCLISTLIMAQTFLIQSRTRIPGGDAGVHRTRQLMYATGGAAGSHPKELVTITLDTLQNITGRNISKYLLYTTETFRLHRYSFVFLLSAQFFKVMSHGTIRNDDFQRNTALQCWSNVVTIRNNVATMLQLCVALKIVVANLLV